MPKGCRSKIYCNEKEPDSGLRYDMYLGLRMITYHTLLSSFSSFLCLTGIVRVELKDTRFESVKPLIVGEQADFPLTELWGSIFGC